MGYSFYLCFFFFNRNTYRNINDIAPELLKEPVLEEAISKNPIEIIGNGYKFSLTPVFQCQISGLIVDNSARPFMVSRSCGSLEEKKMLEMNKSFTIIWGSNISNKIYKNNTINFSGGEISWKTSAAPNLGELANISLIANNKDLWSRIKGISRGDQVEVRGRLVDVGADRAISIGHLEYKSGLPGKGNLYCVIYVEDLRILKKANAFYHYLFWFSLFCLIALGIYRLFGPLRPY